MTLSGVSFGSAGACTFATPDRAGKRPLIGVTSDFIEKNGPVVGTVYSEYPWCALGKRYGDAVVRTGGIPVILICDMACVEAYAQIVDGLLITSSAFDVDPALYGEPSHHPTTVPRPVRTQFEWTLTRMMLALDKPIFSISGGMQLMNVVEGGTLFQHLIEEVPQSLNHTQFQVLTQPQHTVEIDENSNLADIIRTYEGDFARTLKDPQRPFLRLETNSYHHQGVKNLGRGLRVEARSVDGVVEAIWSTEHRFCLGVQWQAEFCLTPVDIAIFKAFIHAASES